MSKKAFVLKHILLSNSKLTNLIYWFSLYNAVFYDEYPMVLYKM